jgi:hypothetical protein
MALGSIQTRSHRWPSRSWKVLLYIEALVLGVLHRPGTGRHGPREDVVDLGAALRGQGDDCLGVRDRVGDLLVDEGLEERLDEQHHARLLADHHAGGLLVGELRVELEPERGEELNALRQALHGQVHEDHSGHGVFPSSRFVWL